MPGSFRFNCLQADRTRHGSGRLLLPAACPTGEQRLAGRVLGRVPGAARWFVGKRARHGADCCCSYIGSSGKGAAGSHRRRFSGLTVTTFGIMKHEPAGGEVRRRDRRRADTSDISAPPAS